MVMRYEPATRTSTGPAPGAVALRDYARARGLGDAGIYNPRPIRGGTSLSLHAEGRAVDITPGDRDPAAVTELVADLIGSYQQLGVQQIIWWRHSWRCDRRGDKWRPYLGADPHTGHAHVELTRAAAAGLTVSTIRDLLGDFDVDTSEKVDAIYRFLFTGLNQPGDQVPGEDHGGYALLSMNGIVQGLPDKLAGIGARIEALRPALASDKLDPDKLAGDLADRLALDIDQLAADLANALRPALGSVVVDIEHLAADLANALAARLAN